MGDVKRICERALNEKWDYKKDTLKYLRTLMLSMSQKELILELDLLSYNELKMAAGSGIPGEAQQFARDKLKSMREKADASIKDSTSFSWIHKEIEVPQKEENNAKS